MLDDDIEIPNEALELAKIVCTPFLLGLLVPTFFILVRKVRKKVFTRQQQRHWFQVRVKAA